MKEIKFNHPAFLDFMLEIYFELIKDANELIYFMIHDHWRRCIICIRKIVLNDVLLNSLQFLRYALISGY